MLTAVLVAAVAPSLHVRVDGDGYLRFVREGRTVYSREATLTVIDGKLACPEGPVLNPRVQVPADVTELSVDLGGVVTGGTAGVSRELGRIVLALFPDDVRMVVEDGFLVSSYRPDVTDPGVGTAGVIRVAGPAPATTTAPTTVVGVEVRLKDSAEVDGKAFLLGEIATIVSDSATKARLEALEVSTTPALGGALRMTAEMVRTRLLRYGKEAETYKFSGSNQVTVTRRGQMVTASMFSDAALKAARAELGPDTELSAEAGGVSMTAPVGKLDLVGESVLVSGNRVSVRIAIIVDGERINSRTLTLDKSDAVSKMRAGQTVKLLVRSGSAVVETTGRVRSIDHATGVVAVTSATGAELSGKVVGIDTVEVVL
jgi:hypothetical protein